MTLHCHFFFIFFQTRVFLKTKLRQTNAQQMSSNLKMMLYVKNDKRFGSFAKDTNLFISLKLFLLNKSRKK